VQPQPLVDALFKTVLAQGVINANKLRCQCSRRAIRNPPSLRLGLHHYSMFSTQGGCLRFQPESCGRTCSQYPWLMKWQAGLRCFCWAQGQLRSGHHRIGSMGYARCSFFDLYANKSQLSEHALHSIGGLYKIERQAQDMDSENRGQIRQVKASSIPEKSHTGKLAEHVLYPKDQALPSP